MRLGYFDGSCFQVYNSLEPSSLVNVVLLDVIVFPCFCFDFLRRFSDVANKPELTNISRPRIQVRLLIIVSVPIVSRCMCIDGLHRCYLLVCLHALAGITALTSLFVCIGGSHRCACLFVASLLTHCTRTKVLIAFLPF